MHNGPKEGSTIKFEFADGFWFAPPAIDELTEMPPLESVQAPFRVDFVHLNSINSYGIRKMIRLIREWEPRPFEFHNCPGVMIDSINVVRALIGSEPDPSVVKSYAIPHFCEGCDRVFEIRFEAAQVTVHDGTFDLPDQICPDCGKALELEVEADEYLVFMEGLG